MKNIYKSILTLLGSFVLIEILAGLVFLKIISLFQCILGLIILAVCFALFHLIMKIKNSSRNASYEPYLENNREFQTYKNEIQLRQKSHDQNPLEKNISLRTSAEKTFSNDPYEVLEIHADIVNVRDCISEYKLATKRILNEGMTANDHQKYKSFFDDLEDFAVWYEKYQYKFHTEQVQLLPEYNIKGKISAIEVLVYDLKIGYLPADQFQLIKRRLENIMQITAYLEGGPKKRFDINEEMLRVNYEPFRIKLKILSY